MGSPASILHLFRAQRDLVNMLLTLLFLQRIFLSQCLINLDWATLEREVTIRYFSPDLYIPSQDVDDLWYGMGRNITCRVQDEEHVSVTLPSEFVSNYPIK